VLQNKPKGAVRILFAGDIYGKSGVEAIRRLLPGLIRSLAIDFCIANGENAEQGKGITPRLVKEILDSGVDVITGGNHTLYRDKIHDIIESEPRILRPYNFPEGTPGHGLGIFDSIGHKLIAVLNLHGRALLQPSDDPFRIGKKIIEELRTETNLIFVDFHAEATAEKLAFARYIDGLATAVIGTHTHVQTADEQILPAGTGFITDVGMTGSHSGVIGMDTESALHRFLYPMGGGKAQNSEGDARLSAVIIDADPVTGNTVGIERIQKLLG
jgi:2',3'-cyclic-nucleotide 2'-phosphodiesterase